MPDSPGLEALYIRLYLDRHVIKRLAVDLRGQGFDVLTTEEAGKDTASDEEQLAFARVQTRFCAGPSGQWVVCLAAPKGQR